MPRGGKRPGAGRKKGTKLQKTLDKEAGRAALREIVLRHMEEMTASQIEAAKGLRYLVKRSKQGGTFTAVTKEQVDAGLFDDSSVIIEVWDKQPSTPAFTDLMNRALDKPKEQPHEVNVTATVNLVDRLREARKRADA